VVYNFIGYGGELVLVVQSQEGEVDGVLWWFVMMAVEVIEV
jgi:hypothetical protein